MTDHQRRIKMTERKYRKIKLQSRSERLKKQLPLLLLYLLLMTAAVLLVWYRTRPQPAAFPPESLRVYILDVGQGDAALLQTDSQQILIDAGDYETGTRIVQILHALGISHLDAVINSHPHADHIGGLQRILEQIPADVLYLPEFPESCMPTGYSFSHVLDLAQEKQIPVRQPACHEKLHLGSAELEFLCTDTAQYDNLNDCSLLCRVTCGGRSMLFTGDLGKEAEQDYLAAGLIAPADILKVGHHGSSGSSSAEFLAAVQPEYAAISCGAMNDYGHPSQKTLRALRDANCAVYRTDLDGTVLFLLAQDGIRAFPYYDFGFFEGK